MPDTALSTLYSHHIFLFPFEWRLKNDRLQLMEEKTDLKLLNERIAVRRDLWERRGSWLKPQSLVQYNEAVYFYDFVRSALYDTGENETFLSHFYYKLPATLTEYVIQVNEQTTYTLEVDDIVLSLYNTGVGIIAFHLNNTKETQSKPEDILKINQFGRRLYPPFLGTNTDLIGTQAFFEDKDWNKGLKGVKGVELAHSIALRSNGKTWLLEDFSNWATQPRLDGAPWLIEQLLPADLVQDVQLSPVLDDRMFVVCWYGNDDLVYDLKEKRIEDAYKKNDWWYQYTFVDGGYKTCQNDEMTEKLLKEHTNPRWAQAGTLYGVSRYSLVCLTETMATNGFTKVLCSHVQTMYYKIALLTLVQRACVLRFSEEVTAISQLKRGDRMISKKVSSLYKQYLRFINKIYFREVTAQEQGIEIYDLLQKHMRLQAQTQELEREIQELHNYAQLIEEGERNDKLALLTYIGALLLGPSFVVSFLGVDTDLFEPENPEKWLSLSFICLAFAALAIGVVRSSRNWRWLWLILLTALTFFFLFAYIFILY